jgi:hypothetical protein
MVLLSDGGLTVKSKQCQRYAAYYGLFERIKNGSRDGQSRDLLKSLVKDFEALRKDQNRFLTGRFPYNDDMW